MDEDGDGAAEGTSKRVRDDNDDDDVGPEAANALPSDFFANANDRPPPAAADDDDDDGDDEVPAPAAAAEIGTEDDPEWAAFEASLSAGPPPQQVAAPSTASATIFAAPVEYEFGAPKIAEEGGEGEGGAGREENDGEEGQEEETEEEKMARLEQEEREEIMGRILQEEREQIEMDEKVAVSRGFKGGCMVQVLIHLSNHLTGHEAACRCDARGKESEKRRRWWQ